MGRAVAPATVDPYLRMVPIPHAIFDHFGAFTNANDRSRLLGAIFYNTTTPKPNRTFAPVPANYCLHWPANRACRYRSSPTPIPKRSPKK